jgi:hypothetical protein
VWGQPFYLVDKFNVVVYFDGMWLLVLIGILHPPLGALMLFAALAGNASINRRTHRQFRDDPENCLCERCCRRRRHRAAARPAPASNQLVTLESWGFFGVLVAIVIAVAVGMTLWNP